LAVNRNFTNQNGEREADFINCVVWRKPAETLADYTQKGSQIAIRGRIQTRNYENKEGQRVYVTEVNIEEFTFLDSKNNQNSNNSQNNNAGRRSNNNQGNYARNNQNSNSKQSD